MSLDVYLESETRKPKPASSGIFVRQDGANKEITREEWDLLRPGCEPVTVRYDPDETTNELYQANITHNLGEMAAAAGIYEELWRPEEIDIVYARDLIKPLEDGLSKLVADPETFTAHNPPNGWGTYEGLVAFVTNYLKACREFPGAKVRACR